jgi:uncharacterized membrane protein YhiD involved in acid resistance
VNFDPILGAATAQGLVAPSVVLVDLVLAFVLGMAVAWLYGRTHHGLSYSRNMAQSLVLLCMIVAMVMLVVGDSVARAFGLVGALAIIRFRTVVRDARDTTFIFFALVIGIAIGVHQYPTAVVGTIVIGLTIVLLQTSNFAARRIDTGILRVRGTKAALAEVPEALESLCPRYELMTARDGKTGDDSECTYRIRLVPSTVQRELASVMRAIPDISQVTVAADEGGEEW